MLVVPIYSTMTSDQSQTASPVPSSSPLSSLTSSRINSLPRLSANSSISSSPVTIQDKYCANCKRRQPLQNFRSNCNPTRLLARCVKCQQKRTATDAGLQPSTRPARGQRQQSPTFHRRGINSQDTPETAAVRAERTTMQRNHRTRRRDGEDPSATSPLSEMLRQRQPVPILPSPMPPPPEYNDGRSSYNSNEHLGMLSRYSQIHFSTSAMPITSTILRCREMISSSCASSITLSTPPSRNYVLAVMRCGSTWI